MHRGKDMIIFDEQEQATFSVEPAVTIADAIALADVFGPIGKSLVERTQAEADTARHESYSERIRRHERGLQLIAFSNRLAKLCAAEMVDEALERFKQ